MISMKDCLIPNEDFPSRYESHCGSRFPAGFYYTEQKGFRTHVKTQLLNPLIPYTVNLVFNHASTDRQAYVDLKYRINGNTRTSTVYLAKKRDDRLHMAELCQVTSNGSLVDLEIDFENPGINIKGVEGILFQPLEKVENQVLEDGKVEDIQPILDLDSDTYLGQKLPNDYEEILKLSKHSVEGKTKKDLYSMLCQGFLIDNGQHWFTVDKNGKKCQMLSTRATCVIDDKNSIWESSNESRFGEQLVITAGDKFKLVSEIEPTTLSPDTKYASYLVYKLPEDQSTFDAPMFVWEKDGYMHNGWYIYLGSPPNTPVIGQKFNENNYNPLNRHKLNALPRKRSDGWMEVKAWQFDTKKTPETVSVHLKLEHPSKKYLCGLIIQGIEIRPV
ncbi:kinase-like domain, phloem protein 2-like protein [Tanacetum coccineum]|uniref:Kinase-like domain, phloem protein 2-like protein n=1 Tax=Tanacetum coccineum TaxID=301880 RepID=A0ABQ4WCC4_9ASTR